MSKSFIDNPALQFITKKTEQPKEAPDGYKLNPELVEKKSKRVQLVLKPSLYEKLKAAADKAGISVNEYAHKAFEAILDNED